MVRIALTGTPGTGKSTLAALARQQSGWTVVDAAAWAREVGAVVERDADRDTDVVDTDALAARLPPDDGVPVLYDAHWSHLLGVDEAWVVRCDPAVLRGRLEARGYGPDKVRDNLESEALDLILQEALDHVGRVIQRDGTGRSPQELLATFAAAHTGGSHPHDLEAVDWSDRLPF